MNRTIPDSPVTLRSYFFRDRSFLVKQKNYAILVSMSGIPIALNILISVVAAAMGVHFGVRAHRREPISDASKVLNHSPHLWFVLVSPLALLVFHATFHFNPELEWSLPYPVQFYYGPFSWILIISCFTYFAGFGGAVFLTSKHPKRWQLGVAMALLFVALQQYHARATEYVPPQTRKTIIESGVFVHQSTKSTCVAAAAATALNLMGNSHSEAELIELLGTDYEGTLPSQLVMAMRRLGYREKTIHVDRDGLEDLQTPAVIFLQHNIHALTLVKTDENGALIWDPDRGKYLYDWAKLRIVLAGSHIIEFSKTD